MSSCILSRALPVFPLCRRFAARSIHAATYNRALPLQVSHAPQGALSLQSSAAIMVGMASSAISPKGSSRRACTLLYAAALSMLTPPRTYLAAIEFTSHDS
jgi:hypothetical protein